MFSKEICACGLNTHHLHYLRPASPSVYHAGQHFRWVLQIRVHCDNSFPVRLLETRKKCGLVTEVTPETNEANWGSFIA